MKKIGKVLMTLFVVGVLVAMFFTNPGEADVYRKVKEKEGKLSMVDVSDRTNFFLFSLYRVDFPISFKHSKQSYLYLGIFNQVVEINSIKAQ